MAVIREERESLVEALARLTTEDLDQRSLCPDYTVPDVVAHLIATTTLNPPGFLLAMLRGGFTFNAMARRKIDEVGAGRSNAELVEL